jgi:hypothetical protein
MSPEPANAADGRIQRLRSLIEGPADVWLLLRMSSWAAVLPLLKHVVRLNTLARLMWTDGESKSRSSEAAKIVALSRLLARPGTTSRGTCYERSLLAYRFLSQRGAAPRLIVAVKREAGGVRAHAWVMVGDTALGESEAIDEFVPVVVYGPGGRAESADLSGHP